MKSIADIRYEVPYQVWEIEKFDSFVMKCSDKKVGFYRISEDPAHKHADIRFSLVTKDTENMPLGMAKPMMVEPQIRKFCETCGFCLSAFEHAIYRFSVWDRFVKRYYENKDKSQSGLIHD